MHCFTSDKKDLDQHRKLLFSVDGSGVLSKVFFLVSILCFLGFSNSTLAHQTNPSPSKKTATAKRPVHKSRTAKNSSHKKIAQPRLTVNKQKKTLKRKVKSKELAKPIKEIVTAKPAQRLTVANIPQRLVHFVESAVNNLRYSAYKLGGTRFDTKRGIYVLDCSSYVDRVLQTVHPRGFSKLVNYSGSAKPTTQDYYQFFNNLTDEPQHYWDTIDDVSKLRPGDLLVFRYRNDPANVTKGHIVIVMEKPIRHRDVYRVRISDSAPVRHSQDTRLARVSGIGIGTMLLRVNPKTFKPFAYAWGVHSKWEKNVRFAMARPIDLNKHTQA